MGVRGVSIIAHGSANGTAILNACRMADSMCRNNINEHIVEIMAKINTALRGESAMA